MKYLPLILSIAFPVAAVAIETNENYVACRSEHDLDLVVRAASSGDKASFSSLVDNRRCLIMKGGIKVTITEWPGMFGKKVQFMINGTTFWTPRAGINFKD